jgi:hypothetical protein
MCVIFRHHLCTSLSDFQRSKEVQVHVMLVLLVLTLQELFRLGHGGAAYNHFDGPKHGSSVPEDSVDISLAHLRYVGPN